MGLAKSKHVTFFEVFDHFSSQEFKNRRKISDKGEFVSEKEATRIDLYEMLCPTEREDAIRYKRATFLEPQISNHAEFADVFRQKSLLSEANEFTFAKALLEAKEKVQHSRRENDKKSLKIRKASHKRNLSQGQ